MKKSIASLLVTLLGLALLIYSATRSVDFIMATLPPDRQILAWFGLAALDGGLVFWLLHFLSGAKGGMQRAIALLMVLIDFLGAVAMFTADTIYRAGEAGMVQALSPAAVQTVILGLSLVIAANIAAVVLTHISDPEARRSMVNEEAAGAIEDLALKTISENAARLASEVAPQMAAQYLEDLRSQYLGAMTRRQAKAKATIFSKNLEVGELPELEVTTDRPNDGRPK
jgi:hypothetical protein